MLGKLANHPLAHRVMVVWPDHFAVTHDTVPVGITRAHGRILIGQPEHVTEFMHSATLQQPVVFEYRPEIFRVQHDLARAHVDAAWAEFARSHLGDRELPVLAP